MDSQHSYSFAYCHRVANSDFIIISDCLGLVFSD
jgi:hypothetical protein